MLSTSRGAGRRATSQTARSPQQEVAPTAPHGWPTEKPQGSPSQQFTTLEAPAVQQIKLDSPRTGEVVTTWLPPEQAALIRERAAAADRSVAAEIRRALRGYLNDDDETVMARETARARGER